MTVVVWDGKTLAADRRATFGATVKSVCKLRRIDNNLAAVTGDLSIGMEMLDWYERGAIATDYPASNRNPDRGASLIVVRADGSVWRYESSPYPFRVLDEKTAFGSGEEAAMVALACGKTAVEAVELASRFNSGCGNGCDALDLHQAA